MKKAPLKEVPIVIGLKLYCSYLVSIRICVMFPINSLIGFASLRYSSCSILSSFTHQTWRTFFFLQSSKQDLMKNVGNQTTLQSIWIPLYGQKTM